MAKAKKLLEMLGAQFVFHFAAVAFYGFRLLWSWLSLDFFHFPFPISPPPISFPCITSHNFLLIYLVYSLRTLPRLTS